MTKYTIADVGHIIPVEQTGYVIEAVETYLNKGIVPEFDPCLSCEPNHARKLIALIKTAERNGIWPPKRTAAKKATPKKPTKTEGELVEEGYTVGIMSLEEAKDIRTKRPEMFKEK